MTTKEDGTSRPYAPPANIIAALQRLRRMNMPPRITREFLSGAGITENLISRVIAALRFLQFINEADEPTDALRALASGTEEQYRDILGQALRTAYAEDFLNVNPATDPQQHIVQAFQRYTPRSQVDRMVMLFLGLCREAGMQVYEAPRDRGMQPPATRRTQPSRTSGTTRKTGLVKPTSRVIPQGQTIEQVLGITLEDIAHMSQDDFNTVWTALGTVLRSRANRLHVQLLQDAQQENSDQAETGEGGEDPN